MVLSPTGLIQYKGFSHCNFNCKNSLLQGSIEVIICVYWLKVPVLKSLLAWSHVPFRFLILPLDLSAGKQTFFKP